jgi:hypothetical protein
MIAQLKTWLNVFQEAKVTQPLAQLQRDFYFLALEELARDRIPAWDGVSVESGRLLQLMSQSGWKAPQGEEGNIIKDLGYGFQGEICLSVRAWALKEYKTVEVLCVTLQNRLCCGASPLESGHPVAYSELKRDLEYLKSPWP